MYKVILWGMKETYNRLYNVIKFEEMKKNIEVVGIVSLETYVNSIDGYNVLDREELEKIDMDYIVVMASGKNYKQIIQEAINRNIPREKIIAGEVLYLPKFDFASYVEIYEKNISIIADCCWGGVSRRMRMPFLSPFINVLIKGWDYIKLLESLDFYFQQSLELDLEFSTYYSVPFGRLGDIHIGFPHDTSFKLAQSKWNSRKGRVNFDELLIEMKVGAEDELAERFNALPYKRKIGFSSVPMQRDSILYLPEYNIEKKGCALENHISYQEYEPDFGAYILSDSFLNSIDYFALMEGNIPNIRRRKFAGIQ